MANHLPLIHVTPRQASLRGSWTSLPCLLMGVASVPLSRKPQLHINHNFYIIHHIHSFVYSYSSRNLFYLGTISSYYFKSNVLRVLLELELPNSEHRSSSYVRNNPAYSMSKADAGIFLAHGSTLSEFLGHLGSEFEDTYFLRFVLLEVYFT